MKETAKEAFERCLQNVSLEEKPDAEWVAQQYAVEQAGALAIKEAAPFSEERERITRQCYEMVDRLIQARSRQKGQSVAAYGAGESFVDLLDQLIRYLHTKKPEINFFEAGVGTGYILRAVHQLGGVHVSGCDVCLDRQLLGELSSCCIEKTLYAALGELKDGSVDLFYWNDVMEHLPEDEMEETLRQIAKKLSPEGLLVTVTPSRGMGPHDITKLAAPKELEAKGLHLREYCYYEVVEQNQRAGLRPRIYAVRNGDTCCLDFEQGEARSLAHAAAEKRCFRLCKNIPVIGGKSIRKRMMCRFGWKAIVICGK